MAHKDKTKMLQVFITTVAFHISHRYEVSRPKFLFPIQDLH